MLPTLTQAIFPLLPDFFATAFSRVEIFPFCVVLTLTAPFATDSALDATEETEDTSASFWDL